jgi:hypothetical protein
LDTKPEGRLGIGRPKLRWLDDIETGMKCLAVNASKPKSDGVEK